ncbi:hypothetical protein [uncultured Methanobacterium sp.]|uniref:hypothetical protein n=1 Tax=uncultured Methanobacterium sp. TaxID=176306 RepID=UPI002AA79A24|nr:hypothetical protein [uncultured Methanobacterium sp.]
MNKRFNGYLVAFVIIALAIFVSGRTSLTDDSDKAINDSITSYFNDTDTKSGENATADGDQYKMTLPSSVKIGDKAFNSSNQVKVNVTRKVAIATTINQTETSGTTKTTRTGTEIDLKDPQWEELWEFTLEKKDNKWQVVSTNLVSSQQIQ